MSSSNEHAVSMEDKSKTLRKWTIVDETGHTESMELDNYTIRQRFHISVRDLRILDRDHTYPSTILAREKAILFNIEQLRMIITAKEVLILEDPAPEFNEYVVFVRPQNDYPARFQQKLMSMILHPETDSDTENESAFEFCALKLALESLDNFLDGERESLISAVAHELSNLTLKITGNNHMTYSHDIKQDLTAFTVRVQKVRDEIKRLMENEPGLAEFYLSRKLARASSSSVEPMLNPTSHVVDNDVDELQMLLEKHFYQIKSYTEGLCQLKVWVGAMAVYHNTLLDEIRNQLIKFEVIISSASICLSVFALVAAILGMNIPYSWNNQKDMFKWVVIVTGTICAIFFAIIMSYARYKKLVDFGGLVGFLKSVGLV